MLDSFKNRVHDNKTNVSAGLADRRLWHVLAGLLEAYSALKEHPAWLDLGSHVLMCITR